MLCCCIIAILLLRVIALAECGFNTSSRAFIAAMRSITNRVWPTFCRMPKYSSELITRPRLHFPDPERSPVFFHRTLSLYENFPHLPLWAAIGVANKPKLDDLERERERESTRVDCSKGKRRKGFGARSKEKKIPILRGRRGKEERRIFFPFFARDDAKDETGNGEKDRDGRERFGTTSRKGGFFSLLLLLFFARRIRETASKNIREAKLESN